MAVRILVYDNTETFIKEVSDIRALYRVEELNGEHSLTLTTSEVLEKQQRLLFRDQQGKWYEYVIIGVEQAHDEDVHAVGTYYAVWSLQYDLEGTIVKTQPGKVNPVTSTVALQHALGGTSRWTVGSVTQNTTGGASMYYISGWEALGQVVEVWGGEVDATITLSQSGGVLSREVDLLDHLGSAEAVRRFDYSADLTSIIRTVEDANFTCRIIPRGSAVESENGGYGRKVDITSVNGGVEYIEDPDVVDMVKLPDGNGGFEYPTQIVDFEGIDDPQTLYDMALAHLHDYTRPRVSYEAGVIQLEAAGMDPHGITLGDTVDVVDRAFTPQGLRLEGRVVRVDWDELDPARNELTIGFIPEGFAGQFSSIRADIRAINDWRDTLTTEEYIVDIISRLNETVNATGGYTYIVPGIGMVTYDVAVTDPAIGAEASAAVEVRGGTIRIADSKDAQGNWEWNTVFTAGHIAGELVTAAEIVTGYIGSVGGTYIDLDNNTVQLGDTSDTSITIGSDGIRFLGKDGSLAGLIDSGALETVGMNIGLVGADTEAEFAAGNASTGYIRYEQPDFGLGDLEITVEFEVGGVPTTEAHSFSAYGTHAGTYTTVTVTAPSGSDPWSVTLAPSTSGMALTRFRGHYYISSSAPRVAFGNGEATGSFAFAVGEQAKATNRGAFASGVYSEANGFASIASGTNLISNGASQAVFGKNNVADSTSLLIVGNGTDQNTRSNALALDGSGNLALAGSITASNLTPVEIKRSDLTFTRCSQNGSSPCGWRIGNLVIVYIRLSVTGSGPTVSGFPGYTAANSSVSVSVYRQSDNAALGGYMTNAGVLTLPTGANGNNLMCSCVYVAS